MFVLGIDYGTKRIGLALGSTEMGIITPLPTVPNDQHFFKKIIDLIRNYPIERFIIGIPITNHLYEVPPPLISDIKKIAEKLYQETGITHEFVNETLTSAVLSNNIKNKDSHSAVLIIEDFFNNKQLYE